LEWETNERDAWVVDAQRWIEQIKGVLQCKIDLDGEGEILGVHVVAGMDREPRHLVRDVESLLKARLDIDVFYKKIGVVQVLDNGEPQAPVAETKPAPAPAPETAPRPELQAAAVAGGSGPLTGGVSFHPPQDLDEDSPAPAFTAEPAAEQAAPAAADPVPDIPDPIPAVLLAEEGATRVICSGVGVMASDMIVRAEVQLRAGSLEARGTREGPNHAGSDLDLVARAVLDALGQMLEDPVLLHLKEIRLEELGGQMVVLVAVDLVEGRRTETLFGACRSGHNRQQGVVYAVLDAVNRRLALLGLKAGEASG